MFPAVQSLWRAGADVRSEKCEWLVRRGAFWESVSAERRLAGDCAEWGRGWEGVKGLGRRVDRIDRIDRIDWMDWMDWMDWRGWFPRERECG